MSPTTRILRPFLARQWHALAGAGGATVSLTAADLAKPWPVALVIDHLIAGREGAFQLSPDDGRLLAGIAGLVVLIALVDALSTYLTNLFLQRAGERITHELRVAVYAHLQRLSLGFHQRRQKGDLVTRVTGDTSAVGALFADVLGPMTQSALLLVGMLAVTLVLDPLLALVAFASVPLLAGVSFRYRRKVRVAAKRQRRQEGEIASLANEALSAMPVVKAFGSERFEHARIERRSERRMDLGMQVARLQARLDGMAGVLTAIGAALVIVVGVLRVAAGAITPGDLVVFASYARKVNSPLRSLARNSAKASKAMARADRIAELLAAEDVLEDRPGAWSGGRARGEIALDGVSFAYEPGRPVLREVSLDIPAGSRVAVMGPSGSGKSTLGALIARFYDPGEGSVALDGRDERDCAVAWLRDQIGVLLQDTVLFTGTVAENIAYASGASREEVAAAARAAAADRFIEELPDGYDAPLGPQGVGLSGGQRQRVGIARTLLRDPPVLLLDEPTTGLDAESRDHVLQGLFTLMEGRTTILITHSLELARRADRVLLVDEGRIVADGPPEEVLRSPRVAIPRPAPADPGLPHLAELLDPERMGPVLARSLGRDARVEEPQVERLRYKPGRRLVVRYRVSVDGQLHDAVATALAGVDLCARARKRGWDAIAREINGRSPAVTPLAYDEEVDALVSWLPFDPALPALLVPSDELGRRLADAGLEPLQGEPRLLGYKAGMRAVLRWEGHVLKAYGKDRQYQAALAGLRTSDLADGVPAPHFEAAMPDLRLTVQSVASGACPADAAGAARLAGELARRLRESTPGRLRPAPPPEQLSEARRHADLARAILPELGPRLDRLTARLTSGLPAGTPLGPAHGDFHVDQLLLDGADVTLVDFDEMCAAPAALDLATYTADVVRGRPGEIGALQAVAGPLLDGYGEQPAAWEWYLAAAVLCRCTHPFRGFAERWPQRVEGAVGVAEEVLAG